MDENAKTAVHEVHGREVQASGEAYFLPADAQEKTRLDLQHTMVCLALNGLYPAADLVDRIMAPREDGVRPSVLDVATGSGIWAIDMAERFPHADVVGIDIVPVKPKRPLPTNCHFDVANANHGFAQYPQGFDVIHFRFADFAIAPWREGLLNAQKALRPGGILIIVANNNIRVYDEQLREVITKEEGDPNGSYFQFTMDQGRKALLARSPTALDHLKSEETLKGMGGWSSIKKDFYFIDIGAWDPNRNENEARAAELQQRNLMEVMLAIRPMMLMHGFPAADVDRWVSRAREELSSMEKRHRHEFYSIWAIKDTALSERAE